MLELEGRPLQSGEYDYLPGVRQVRSEFDVRDPRQRRKFKRKNKKEFYDKAKEMGRDIVAYTKGREIRLVFGVGIAIAGLKGGIALYKHRQQKRK